MRNKRFHKLPAMCLLPCLLGVALVAAADDMSQSEQNAFDRYFGLNQTSDNDDWTRHFRIGAMAGLNISAKFNESGTFNLAGNNAAGGIYDDGYVHPDQTGSADGLTSYWGYNNASQYDPAARTLSLHSTTSYTTGGGSEDTGSPFAGFDLAYGGNLWNWRRARIGWELGFGILPVTITDHQPMSASVNQSTYTFDTGGIILPDAPYQGGADGTGPLISDHGNLTGSSAISSGTITGSRQLDAMFYTIRLGPSLYWDLSDNIGISLGAGPAIGVASMDYKFDEVVTTASGSVHNAGRFGTTDVVFGGYVNAALMYHFQDNGQNADIYISAEYMPMGSAGISHGGRSGQLDLAGQVYISAGINWPF